MSCSTTTTRTTATHHAIGLGKKAGSRNVECVTFDRIARCELQQLTRVYFPSKVRST